MSLEAYWSQELARKRQLLTRYQSLRDSKAKVAQADKAMKDGLSLVEGQFLSGSNPAVASADLQEVLKNLSRDHGVNLTSAKVLQAREAGPYLEVPVQVQLSGNVAQILTILYHLEHHKKLLFVTEIEINAPRWVAVAKETGNLQINLVVSGLIKKASEPGKKGIPS